MLRATRTSWKKEALSKSNCFRTLGIDPGTATGWAIVESKGTAKRLMASGTLRIDPFDGTSGMETMRALESLMVQADAVAIEFTQAYTIRRQEPAGVTALVVLAAARLGMVPRFYHPNSVRKQIAGSGRAKTKEIRRAVQKALGNVRLPEHELDATAVALYEGESQKIGAVDETAPQGGR